MIIQEKGRLDTNVLPHIPIGWNLKGEGARHLGIGKVEIENRDDRLYINNREVLRFPMPKEAISIINAQEILERFLNALPLNDIILDYLLEEQDLIPGSWKEGNVYFLGTIFSNQQCSRYVSYLHFAGKKWRKNYCYLGCRLSGSESFAILIK